MFKFKSVLAATAALAIAITPAVAEELVVNTVQLPDGSQVAVTEYRTSGLSRRQTRMQTGFHCSGEPLRCVPIGNLQSESPSIVEQVAPVATAAVFGASIRPTRISEGDTNVSNGSNSSSASNQTQLQGQGQEQEADGGLAIAEGGNAHTGVTAIASNSNDNLAFGGDGGNANALGLGGQGGNANALGVGLGGDAQSNAEGGNANSAAGAIGSLNNTTTTDNCSVVGDHNPNACRD